MKIFEAFKPSGGDPPDRSAGLFTGEPDSIRRYLSINSDVYRPDQIRVQLRSVKHMDAKTLAAWEMAREKARAAGRELDELERTLNLSS